MTLTDAQRERIADYAALEDREDEPVFVGREDLFALVESAARMVGKGKGKGRTICIAGPPGIGKTAFLSKLHERSAEPRRYGNGILTLKIPAISFSRKDELLVQMLEALPESWRPPKGAIPSLLESLQVDQFGVGGLVRVAGRAQAKPPAMDVGGFPWNEMPELLVQVPLEVVVCLLIDEAHGLQPSAGLRKGVERNYAVGGLHEGAPPRLPAPGRRVFGVFAGHTHTPEILEKSISGRFAGESRRYMQGLSEAESLRYVEGILDHLGVSGGDSGRGALAQWIVGECGGFPHHLRNAMGAVAEGFLRADGLSLSGLDGDFVSERLRTRRTDYYEVRTKGAIGQASALLGALLREWSRRAEPVLLEEAEDDLDDLIGKLSAKRRERMSKLDVEDGADLMRELIRKGAVTPDRKTGCRCPIDSLVSWMETNGRRHALRGSFPSLAGSPCRPCT